MNIFAVTNWPAFWRGFLSVWGHPITLGFWLGFAAACISIWIGGAL